MSGIVKFVERRSREFAIAGSLGILALVGVVDFLTGFEIFFSVFYLLAVGLAVWFVGVGFGLFISLLSVGVWIAGDLAAGAHYSTFILVWNAAIVTAFYAIVVWLLGSLRRLQRELESRVAQRTTALTQEMAERSRLEKEIIEISEQEQRRIGRDLHDGLCQHLTGTALAGQVLEEQLAGRGRPEAGDVGRIVDLVENGITMARELARGIYPVEMEAEGLMAAIREFANNTSRWSKVECAFDCEEPVPLGDATTATHLYRIVQEAVRNAIQHGKAKRIVISLSEHGRRLVLTVEDDGAGLPDNWQRGQGVGTRIMAHRASMIGATFMLEPNPTGGTFLKCELNRAAGAPADAGRRSIAK